MCWVDEYICLYIHSLFWLQVDNVVIINIIIIIIIIIIDNVNNIIIIIIIIIISMNSDTVETRYTMYVVRGDAAGQTFCEFMNGPMYAV